MHIIVHWRTMSAPKPAVLCTGTPDLVSRSSTRFSFLRDGVDAGDSMIPADLVSLRSLVPGESEELATDPSLLAGRGGRQPPPSPPAQHSEGQVCDPAIGALVLSFLLLCSRRLVAAPIRLCGRPCVQKSRRWRLEYCCSCRHCCATWSRQHAHVNALVFTLYGVK